MSDYLSLYLPLLTAVVYWFAIGVLVLSFIFFVSHFFVAERRKLSIKDDFIESVELYRKDEDLTLGLLIFLIAIWPLTFIGMFILSMMLDEDFGAMGP